LKIRDDFSAGFWSRYSAYDTSQLINIDEIGILYEMPPKKTLAVRGGSSKVGNVHAHSARMTAVLAIRADGEQHAFAMHSFSIARYD